MHPFFSGVYFVAAVAEKNNAFSLYGGRDAYGRRRMDACFPV